jgi:hypothetical protein
MMVSEYYLQRIFSRLWLKESPFIAEASPQEVDFSSLALQKNREAHLKSYKYGEIHAI